MNRNAHTPGPWLHGHLSDEILASNGEPIAAPPDGYDEDTWAANAPVIAAAPDLLTATRSFVDAFDALLQSGMITPALQPMLEPLAVAAGQASHALRSIDTNGGAQ